VEEITKPEAENLAETDDSLQYLGNITVGAESRHIYRTRIGAADDPRGWKLVYFVD